MNLQHFPRFIITTKDEERLNALLYHSRRRHRRDYSPEVLAFLGEELDRAAFVEPDEVGPTIVTMNSRVWFRDEDSNTSREVAIVYPGVEKIQEGKISILSPVGSALIGLSEGQTITWRLVGGPWRTLRVLKVTYQPEAHGRFER